MSQPALFHGNWNCTGLDKVGPKCPVQQFFQNGSCWASKCCFNMQETVTMHNGIWDTAVQVIILVFFMKSPDGDWELVFSRYTHDSQQEEGCDKAMNFWSPDTGNVPAERGKGVPAWLRADGDSWWPDQHPHTQHQYTHSPQTPGIVWQHLKFKYL